MSRIARNLALLTLLLPVAIGAAEQSPNASAAGSEAGAGEPTRIAPEAYEGASGLILSVDRTEIVIGRLGQAKGTKGYRVVLQGNPRVPVSGEKKSWLGLRKGDFVSVAWSRETSPGTAKKVIVHPADKHPAIAAALGKANQRNAKQRKFIGWIKQKTDEGLVLMSPAAAPPPGKKKKKARAKTELGETRRFRRMDYTTVELKRASWEALKKGDRVAVYFGKGRPRPAERVVVVMRGGEKPLPPGLATRLFHPEYDRTVKDVDGIGEVQPGAEWRPAEAPEAPDETKSGS